MPFDPGWSLPADLPRWIGGALAAATIALVAFRTRSLTRDGAAAAVLLGTAIVGAGGWWAGLLLVAFFVTSSALSRLGLGTTAVASVRGSTRDAVQVVANGGVAGLCALLSLSGGTSWWLLGMAGAIAAANADTWSTEIGRRSPRPPRLITTWRAVPRGTSGAVSALGTVGALLGGALIGLLTALGVAAGWIAVDAAVTPTLAALTIAGFAGSLVDSLLGATIQHQRWCSSCEAPTERPVHHFGRGTTPHRGWPWVTNDVVNVACVLSGALLAAGMAWLLERLVS